MKKPTKYDRTANGARKPIQLLPTVEQHTRIRVAAAVQGKPVTQFLLDLGLKEAEKILAKIAN